MKDKHNETPSALILYQADDGKYQILLKSENDTVWLTLNQMVELYQSTKQNISLHIRKILSELELSPEATVKQNLTVQIENGREVRRLITFYSLEMILAVGYRVRSERGTQFRMWATQNLSEYLKKGFLLDDERLKGNNRVTDYFDELLARIRDIRASEARVYQRIREIFALASDYRAGSKEAQLFFASMQNKMHFAAIGYTAAEIIHLRADADKPNMGLTNWKGNRVQKVDIVTAKNYLAEPEIDILNRIVVMFLDQAEFRVLRGQDIQTRDWQVFLDKFLQDNELPILNSTGKISHDDATLHAEKQFEAFNEKRRLAAEEIAGKRYLDDLRNDVKTVAAKRRKNGGNRK